MSGEPKFNQEHYFLLNEEMVGEFGILEFGVGPRKKPVN